MFLLELVRVLGRDAAIEGEDGGEIGVEVAGRGDHRPESHHAAGVVEVGEDDRDPGPFGDPVEPGAPCRHLLAGSFRGDRQQEPVPSLKHLDHAAHQTLGTAAIHRNPAEPSEQAPRRPPKERCLADPGDPESHGEECHDAERKIPVRGVRGHGDHELGEIREGPLQPPSAEPKGGASQRPGERIAAGGNLVADREGEVA